MSLADDNSMADTLHLLSSEANRNHLAKSISQFKAGKAEKREMIEETSGHRTYVPKPLSSGGAT